MLGDVRTSAPADVLASMPSCRPAVLASALRCVRAAGHLTRPPPPESPGPRPHAAAALQVQHA